MLYKVSIFPDVFVCLTFRVLLDSHFIALSGQLLMSTLQAVKRSHKKVNLSLHEENFNFIVLTKHVECLELC